MSVGDGQHYVILGRPESGYSLKVRSAMRYKELPYEWMDRSYRTGKLFKAHARVQLIPLVFRPDGTATQDSTPILAECTESLIEGSDDIRGLWIGVEGGHVGHVERVEQCGRRVVVTAAGIIHDSGPNSTLGENTNDTEGTVVFAIAGREYCPRTSAKMVWKDGVLDFHIFGWGPVVVKRYLEGDQLIWEYADGSITRMDRICTLPDEHRIPKRRGPNFRFFDSLD